MLARKERRLVRGLDCNCATDDESLTKPHRRTSYQVAIQQGGDSNLAAGNVTKRWLDPEFPRGLLRRWILSADTSIAGCQCSFCRRIKQCSDVEDEGNIVVAAT